MIRPLISSVTLSVSSLPADIYPLIAPIRSEWSPFNTHLHQLAGGINNTTFGLFDDFDQSEALVIKIFGSKTEEFIDRNAELDILCILSKHEFAQSILIQFTNGVIYKFIPGQICTRDDFRDMNIGSLIARQLAKFHSIPIQDDINQKPCIVPLMRKFLTLMKNSKNRPDGD
jgi:ethanolamine kinase